MNHFNLLSCFMCQAGFWAAGMRVGCGVLVSVLPRREMGLYRQMARAGVAVGWVLLGAP